MKNEKLTDNFFPDCKVVDEFVNSFYECEIKLSPKADITDFYDEKHEITSLTDFLSQAIANYTSAKSKLLGLQLVISKLKNHDPMALDIQLELSKEVDLWRTYLLNAITHAKSLDLVLETKSFTSRCKKLQQENDRLKEKNERLQKLNSELAKENYRLHKLFPDNDRGKSQVGGLDSIDS